MVATCDELTVDDEFAAICPPLSPTERDLLEESILREGCRDSIVVWNGIIVDGHNRYSICRKHGIQFSVRHAVFGDRGAARYWILKNQLARRNLGAIQAAYLRGCYYRQARDAGNRCDGYKQEEVARLFSVSTATIRSDRELADSIDTLCPVAREYVLRHGIVASKLQVRDLAKLSHDSQEYIVGKIEDGYLDGLRDAVLRLRPPSTVKIDGIQRKHNRCQQCGCRLAEGVFTCLSCDISDKQVRERIEQPFGLSPDDDCELQRRIACAREYKLAGDRVDIAARVIIQFLEENEVEKSSDCRAILCRLLKLLMLKVGQRKSTDARLRILIDAEGGDRPRLEELTPKEKQCFTAIRDFSMKHGRPPKLVEIADAIGIGQGTEQSKRSAALA